MRMLLFLALFCQTLLASTAITYEGGDGPGAGKHIVFLASDHEYRSEETCPALARILAHHHGFTCTVVFGVDEGGYIKAGSSRVEGLQALREADLFFIFARFLNLPPEEMDEIIAYLDRGGPVVGLRTSSHAFKIPADSPYAKYSFDSKVKGYEGGFGHQILGNTWVGHYGKNHVQGTRLQRLPEQKSHPILRGVGATAFCHAGGYVGKAREGFTVLTHTQPLQSMEPDSAPDPEKGPVPSTWTRHYQDADGDAHRVFHSTQGASEDILDDNYRRLLLNGTLWAAGLEEAITPDLEISFVGPYQPNTFSFGGEARQVKPSDLAEWQSPLMPQGEEHQPRPKK
ncbi:hypothetical protein [Roseibacillus ishigakijimensis]|uniref:Trehalose utilisation n=1 Tax=Roseibacillus ishigakijimensis TaxID=454146 RepID=A0A934RT67_9BACT|nr:hypothetical protein [Roseibacillus ishigakijimensis]MBK1834988.1 hypothetical protein [Roseibacillus ishigakijimensis]